MTLAYFIRIASLTEAEIARHVGEDTKGKAVREIFYNKFEPVSRLQKAALASGRNPEHVDLTVSARAKAKCQLLRFILFCIHITAPIPSTLEDLLMYPYRSSSHVRLRQH